MATYLSLVQDLARESGTLSPSSITSVTGLTGRPEKLAGWVRQAWTNIQNSRRDWGWMEADFTAPLSIGIAEYTPASLGISDRFGRWITSGYDIEPFSIYETATGVTDENALEQIDYRRWQTMYGRGYHDAMRPTYVAIAPDQSLRLGATPDDNYKLRGIYYKSPQTLSAATDIPEMPSRYHDMIWMEAHRLLLIHDGAYQEQAWPKAEFDRMRFELERDYLPEIVVV